VHERRLLLADLRGGRGLRLAGWLRRHLQRQLHGR